MRTSGKQTPAAAHAEAACTANGHRTSLRGGMKSIIISGASGVGEIASHATVQLPANERQDHLVDDHPAGIVRSLVARA